MSFFVRVAVFPVQISSTEPITSGEFKFFTKIPSSLILITEKAKEIAMVKGRPSGTATMIIVIARVISSQKASNV
jgi:hypothetical protein